MTDSDSDSIRWEVSETLLVYTESDVLAGDTAIEYIRSHNSVPVADLKDVVEDLREKERELFGANERIEGYEYARRQLEELIEDE